jgi:hypothetical protein
MGFDLAAFRGEMLSRLFAKLGSVRGIILQVLDGELRIAFRLGEVIDQGVCPEEIFRDLDDLDAPPSVDAPLAAPFSLDQCSEAGGVWQPPRLRLAGRVCGPGDVPPRPSWLGEVKGLWREAGLPPAMQALPAEAGGSLSRDFVRELARRALEGLAARARANLPPCRLADRLRVVDEGAMTVEFDGTWYTVEYRPAFAILRRLIEGNGELVKTKDLQLLPGCNRRIDKVIPRLPPELRPIIKGDSGSGGYFLQLPPERP